MKNDKIKIAAASCIDKKETMTFLQIRRAEEGDLEQMMEMIDNSRRMMRAGGNDSQWVNGYPSRDIILNDIHCGHSFVATDGGRLVGTFAFIIGRDPTYKEIEGGAWKDDAHPYGTIHRMARSEEGRGIFAASIAWCRRQATSLRIDTHAANATMIYLIEKHGFEIRGVIHLADGSPRVAFQMLPTGELCEPMKRYIDESILPRYASFDDAHRRDHAEAVIQNSLRLASHYEVDVNMVYAIAAYHDLGLCEGRERHHIVSGQIMMSDSKLRQWFSEDNLRVMAEAIEDHRASSGAAPRSIYGRIVAEADRDIEPLKIIKRTVQYGLGNYPELDREAQWRRAVEHLHEKYAEGGYLKLWLPESDNAAKLRELRQIIADEDCLRQHFDRFFDECKN